MEEFFYDISELCANHTFRMRAEECDILPILEKLVEQADRIIKDFVHDGTFRYSIPKTGHRCTFIIHGEKKYVMSLPDQKIEKDLSEINRIRRALNMNEEIILYEEDGFCLMNYAQNVSWNYKYIDDSVQLLKKIHESKFEIKRKNVPDFRTLEWRFRSMLNDRVEVYFGWDACQWIDDVLIQEIYDIKPVLCHGDASFGNVLLYEGKVEWVDWELLQMGNPMFDIFYFFESLYGGQIVLKSAEIGCLLRMYYGERKIEEIEKKNIICMGIYFWYWRILNYAKSGIYDEPAANTLKTLKINWDKKNFEFLFDFFYKGDK